MLQPAEWQDALFPDCPVRNVLARVGDKWSLLVLNILAIEAAPVRFNTLQRALPDISQKVLTTTLRTLEEDGFVIRTVYAEVPPRVDYCLTPRALSFLEACTPMIEWAKAHLDPILTDRQQARNR
ncbi:MAG: winged helix-turn-helix transcriptional regulator [Paludibacteraceae bacterium]